MELFDFQIPYFVRTKWVSTQADRTWSQRISDIQKAQSIIALSCVSEDILSIAKLTIPVEQREAWLAKTKSFGLTCFEKVPVKNKTTRPEFLFTTLLVYKDDQAWKEYKQGKAQNDLEKCGLLLGLPNCCIKHYQENIQNRYEEDPLWQIFADSNSSITAASNETDELIKVFNTNQDNIASPMYHKIGATPFFHFPCSHQCKSTVRFAHKFFELGCASGYCTEMDWLKEMLTWSVEWRSFHGITELTTPLFKMTYNAPSAIHRHTIKVNGNSAPDFSETGLYFPHTIIEQRKVSDSSRYIKGIDILKHEN